ncbi:MAG: cytochrome C [bacterium]|nr:cytochrome C [bacterium]
MNPVTAIVVGLLIAAPGEPAPKKGPPPAGYDGSCTESGCHDDYSRRAVVHAPVDSDSCDACHEEASGDKHRFDLTAEGAELCTECHDDMADLAEEAKVKHAPFAEGECTTCHDPHGSAAGKLLLQPKLGELCGDCHDEVTEDLAFLHGPVAAGACTACHNPHASDEASLLSAPGREQCLSCHAAIKAKIAGSAVEHAPVADECTACHHPHGAANRMNLASEPPTLCLDCHDDVADSIADAEVPHAALTTGRSCTGCHDPHGSTHEKLLAAKPMQLCLSCHDRELTGPKGKLADIAKLLAAKPNRHGPLKDDDCSACHGGVHGGSWFRLLSEQYPAGFYAPYDESRYALCFGCHEAEAFEDAQTDDATEFRNGDVNLHYLHVHRSPKGRTCRACHDVHASSNDQHIAEAVPFGKWQIPINFRPAASGGSCQPGCHRRYRYDRESPVTNLLPPAGQAARP